jgi:hypothetical protein
LRAFFIDEEPSREVAQRFHYSPGAFRVLCSGFRPDPDFRAAFFPTIPHGPRTTPARDRVRQLAVALRTQNLSVYDIQRNLAAAGHAISITALSLLLRAEGFARLPRRPDDQRPPTTKPEPGAPADVRLVNLTPRSFDTQVGGLFLFVPLMRDLRLTEVLGQADLPGSVRIPAAQAVRTLLALKLLGKERKSHVMDLVADQGIALFAGLTRTYRTPKVLEERIRLRGYDGELRQVTVIDLGHEEPTILLTNNEDITFVALVTRYAQRMLIENGIAEAIHFFHLDALSSRVGLKVDFDLQITLMASALYRLMAEKMGSLYQRVEAKTIFHNLLDASATVVIADHEVTVTLNKRAHNPYLVVSHLADQPTPMPWFGDKLLKIRFA